MASHFSRFACFLVFSKIPCSWNYSKHKTWNPNNMEPRVWRIGMFCFIFKAPCPHLSGCKYDIPGLQSFAVDDLHFFFFQIYPSIMFQIKKYMIIQCLNAFALSFSFLINRYPITDQFSSNTVIQFWR